MKQVHTRGVQSYEAADITVCILLYIDLHDYLISLDMKLLLSIKFGHIIFGMVVLWY